MKISILISGKQGSGKTTRMNQILSNCKKTGIKEISPEAFLSLSSDKLNTKRIYVIDGIIDTNQVLQINNLISKFDLSVIATTQLSKEELLDFKFDNFAVVFLT